MDVATLEALIREQTPLAPELGWEEQLRSMVRGEVKLEEPLKRHTTIQIGGPADAYVLPADQADLQEILRFAHDKHVPWMVLGLGSNILVRDGGIRGIVLRIHKAFNRLEILDETEEGALIDAEAGVPLPKLVELCRQRGLTGMENLYGIPGSIGGTLWMNAGTRDGEMKDHLIEIQVLRPDGSTSSYPRNRLKFEYRHLHLPAKEIIVGAKFRLGKAPAAEVQAKISAYQKKRQESQPLEFPNLGSVFKNPEKGFAAQMIEELGLKGVRVGGARISPKHANFIINENQASARDVLVLIGLIRDKVREELDVRLELEAKILGEDEPV